MRRKAKNETMPTFLIVFTKEAEAAQRMRFRLKWSMRGRSCGVCSHSPSNPSPCFHQCGIIPYPSLSGGLIPGVIVSLGLTNCMWFGPKE
jgi:hypothetical protein